MPSSSPPLAQHLGEPRVIPSGREQAAPSGKKSLRAVVLGKRRQGSAINRPIDRRHAIPFALGHEEKRVVHVERLQDSLLQIHVEGLPGDHFDHAAEHVVTESVRPSFARVVRQRNLGETFDLLLDRLDAAPHRVQSGAFIAPAQPGVERKDPAVGESGSVRQQVADLDLPLRRDGGKLRTRYRPSRCPGHGDPSTRG